MSTSSLQLVYCFFSDILVFNSNRNVQIIFSHLFTWRSSNCAEHIRWQIFNMYITSLMRCIIVFEKWKRIILIIMRLTSIDQRFQLYFSFLSAVGWQLSRYVQYVSYHQNFILSESFIVFVFITMTKCNKPTICQYLWK